MAPLRIALVHAPQVYYEQNYGVRFVPVWAYTLAAHIPDSWKVSICDCTVMDVGEIPAADVYAFSGINQDLPRIREVLAALKARFPGATFVLGGPIVWSHEREGRLGDLEGFDHLFVLDGEAAFPDFLGRFGQEGLAKVIRAPRFPLGQARPQRFDLLGPLASRYYGGVVEVSRGCPFLCEFCDIRVLPDNNESHGKDPALIVEELDRYHRLGVRQIQLACDNFIGDLPWAEACVDAIAGWTERTGARVALYTWTTVNLCRHPELMVRMRRAGFTSLFIGVESFNANSILETAKVQNENAAGEMVEALLRIQSHGFLVVPGLIFGFDSDPETMFEDMLEGVARSGLVSGDPTFLLALPGTPLHARMKMARRLLDPEQMLLHKERVSKVESNIRFLQPRDFLVRGYLDFVRAFTAPEYMLRRFRTHVESVVKGGRYVPTTAPGYGDMVRYLRFQVCSWRNLRRLASRLRHLLKPSVGWAVLRAYVLVLRHRRRFPDLANHLSTWLFFWINLLAKHEGLREEHFQILSVGPGYDRGLVWGFLDHEEPGLLPNGRNADNVKVAEQQRRTKQALDRLKAAQAL